MIGKGLRSSSPLLSYDGDSYFTARESAPLHQTTISEDGLHLESDATLSGTDGTVGEEDDEDGLTSDDSADTDSESSSEDDLMFLARSQKVHVTPDLFQRTLIQCGIPFYVRIQVSVLKLRSAQRHRRKRKQTSKEQISR